MNAPRHPVLTAATRDIADKPKRERHAALAAPGSPDPARDAHHLLAALDRSPPQRCVTSPRRTAERQ